MDLLKFMLYKKLWRHKTFWTHSFFSNANFNKSMLQILLRNALYLLAIGFNRASCELCSFLGFLCSGHVTYQIWSWLPKVKAASKTKTWPKTKSKIRSKFKIRRLEVIHRNHFVVKGLPHKSQYILTDKWLTFRVCLDKKWGRPSKDEIWQNQSGIQSGKTEL